MPEKRRPGGALPWHCCPGGAPPSSSGLMAHTAGPREIRGREIWALASDAPVRYARGEGAGVCKQQSAGDGNWVGPTTEKGAKIVKTTNNHNDS